MSVGFQADNFTDLVTTTLRHLQREKWSDFVQSLRKHPGVTRILKAKHIEFGSGYGFQFNAKVATNSAARNVLLMEEDTPSFTDLHTTGNVPYRHVQSHWALEERTAKMNGTPARLVSLVKSYRVDAFMSLFDRLEANWWSTASSSSDVRSPWGVPHYVVKPTATDGDFQGGNPSGFSDTAGINASTYTGYKNWGAKYSVVDHSDLIYKMREGVERCCFIPPIEYPSAVGDRPGKTENPYGWFTVLTTKLELENVLMAQNDNLGYDLNPTHGKAVFHRAPIMEVPYLTANDNTDQPVYGLNFDAWQIFFLKGEYFRESGEIRWANQHRTVVQFVDCSYNTVCLDRRQGGMVFIKV